MNQNLLFVIILVLALAFVVQRNAYIIGVLLAILAVYCWFSANFANPREFITAMQRSGKELFSPCSISNPQYCEQSDSDWTFLPQIFRSGERKIVNKTNEEVLGYDVNEKLATTARIGSAQVPLETILNNIPILQEFKIYLDKVTKFIGSIVTDDLVQRNFLINKLQTKMAKLYNAAYQAVTDPTLPENTYNELLFAEREFATNMNIVSFITLDEQVNATLQSLQTELNTLCTKLNKFIIDKVNDIKPEDYNVLSGRLPSVDEPIAANSLNFDM